MPIYEYVCADCNLKFEKIRPVSQAGETASCPQCHNTAKRALSTFCSLSRDESGFTAPIGGSSCGGCAATNCGSCGI